MCVLVLRLQRFVEFDLNHGGSVSSNFVGNASPFAGVGRERSTFFTTNR